MKKNPIGTLAVALLFLSALATALLATRYFFSVRSLKRMQAQASMVQQSRTVIHTLAQEAVEYSKRDSSIDAILYKYEIKSKGPAGAGVRAPGK